MHYLSPLSRTFIRSLTLPPSIVMVMNCSLSTCYLLSSLTDRPFNLSIRFHFLPQDSSRNSHTSIAQSFPVTSDEIPSIHLKEKLIQQVLWCVKVFICGVHFDVIWLHKYIVGPYYHKQEWGLNIYFNKVLYFVSLLKWLENVYGFIFKKNISDALNKNETLCHPYFDC